MSSRLLAACCLWLSLLTAAARADERPARWYWERIEDLGRISGEEQTARDALLRAPNAEPYLRAVAGEDSLAGDTAANVLAARERRAALGPAELAWLRAALAGEDPPLSDAYFATCLGFRDLDVALLEAVERVATQGAQPPRPGVWDPLGAIVRELVSVLDPAARARLLEVVPRLPLDAQRDALWGLRALEDEEAWDALIAACVAAELEDQARLLGALGELRWSAPLPGPLEAHLQRLATAEPPGPHAAAARGLLVAFGSDAAAVALLAPHLADSAAFTAVCAWPNPREGYPRYWKDLGERAASALRAAASCPDRPELAQAWADRLAERTGAGEPPRPVWEATVALALCGPSGWSALERVAVSHGFTAAVARSALLELDPPDLPTLLEVLLREGEGYPEDVLRWGRALLRRDPARGVATLARVLEEPDGDRVSEAARALEERVAGSGVRPGEVSAVLAAALGRLLNAPELEFSGEYHGRRPVPLAALCRALGACGEASAAPVLARALEASEEDVRREAAHALGACGTAAAAEALLAALERPWPAPEEDEHDEVNPDPELLAREAAAEALDRCASAEHLPRLRALLARAPAVGPGARNLRVTVSLARAAARLGDAAALELLRRFLAQLAPEEATAEAIWRGPLPALLGPPAPPRFGRQVVASAALLLARGEPGLLERVLGWLPVSSFEAEAVWPLVEALARAVPDGPAAGRVMRAAFLREPWPAVRAWRAWARERAHPR